MRKLIKLLIPIFVQRYRMRPRWVGRFASFKDVNLKSSGYSSLNIAQKCLESALQVDSGEKVFERDGIFFNEIQYSYGLLSSLFFIGNTKLELRVIDFGGGFGTTYRQNLILSNFFSMKWTVIEQDSYVKLAENIKFQNSINFCRDFSEINISNYNTIVLSSVLQYLDSPLELIKKISLLDVEFIIIDRTPILKSNIDSFVTLQLNEKNVQDGNYPCWQFNESDLISQIEKKYNRIFKWNSEIDVSNLDVTFCGFLYRLKK